MKIARETLQVILEVCKSTAPLEFAGMLSAKDDVITEVIIVPGTESSDESAVMEIFMLPNIRTVGSVHSHPSGSITPSGADLELFVRQGLVHIIVGAPFDLKSWKCYDKDGMQVKLDVVDYKFNDESDTFITD